MMTNRIVKYIYLIFISFFLAFLTQLINANATSNRFDYALKNMSTENRRFFV